MSNETKWTQGEWRLEASADTFNIVAGDESIMGDETYYPWVPDKVEDWYLIAASPDLYAALESALIDLKQLEEQIDGEWGSCRNIKQIEQDGDLPKSIIEARKVLAKARGEL